MTRLRVATYNVHKCQGLDRRVRVERIRRIIQEVEPDILATQEILKSQAAQISEDLSLPHWFGAARQHANEDYGNATFTRLPVSNAESFDLTVANREPRQCLRIETSGVNFFNIHLGTSFGERRQQVRLLLADHVLDRPGLNGTRIVAGDFNEWTGGLATQLLSQKFQNPRQRTTYPGILPILSLDHIYFDNTFTLLSVKLHRTRAALVGSDHLPLIADFAAQPLPVCAFGPDH